MRRKRVSGARNVSHVQCSQLVHAVCSVDVDALTNTSCTSYTCNSNALHVLQYVAEGKRTKNYRKFSVSGGVATDSSSQSHIYHATMVHTNERTMRRIARDDFHFGQMYKILVRTKFASALGIYRLGTGVNFSGSMKHTHKLTRSSQHNSGSKNGRERRGEKSETNIVLGVHSSI